MAYASVRGNVHRRRDLPNQDAIHVLEKEGMTLVSIADGHGSPVCFRSEIGSKMAVETANEVLNKHRNIFEQYTEEAHKLLAGKIARSWMTACLRHLRANAFADAEVGSLTEDRRRKLGRNALLAYGSTLMTLVIHGDKLTVLNIGDAELLVKKASNPNVELLKPSKRLGNETESLALDKAERYFTIHSYDLDDLEGVLAATDGYPNSFKSESGFLKVLGDLIGLHKQHGMAAIQSNLGSWLDDTSVKGSGDDITACFVARV